MSCITIETPQGLRKVGEDSPTFMIAEMSGNHGQDYSQAEALVDAAAAAGADAIKLQTYTADTLTIDCDNDYFKIHDHDLWGGQTLYQLYQQAYTPWEWHAPLKKRAERQGLTFFSTPFDITAVDFLEKLGVNLYKVASFMTENIPLLERIGQTKKPVILSRGMTSIPQLEHALHTLKQAGCPQIAILHCISEYPATPAQMNLQTIPDLADRFDIVPGLSDHSLGTAVSIAAVALGARIIEKHLTLAREDGGPDAAFSVEPHEMHELINNIRQVEQALGKPTYDSENESGTGKIFKQSIFVVEDIPEGTPLTPQNIRIIRPGYGIEPRHYTEIVGKTTSNTLPRGTPLQWEHINR